MSGFVYQEPIATIADILREELDLDPAQVLASNQKYIIPTVGLFVALSYVGPSKVISNMNEWEDDGDFGLTEIQTIVMQHMLQIDIMAFNNPSGGNDARERKEELAMALRSIYSQQQQEQFSMAIARNIGAIIDTSSLEETEMLTRYSTTIQTTSVNQKRKSVDAFSAFHLQAYTDIKKTPFADFEAEKKPAILGS